MKAFVLSLLSAVSFLKMESQEIFYISPEYPIITGGNFAFGAFDIKNCKDSIIIASLDMDTFLAISDIAVCPDGDFYVIGEEKYAPTGGFTIIGRIDFTDSSLVKIADMPSACSSLACDKNGILYGGGYDLSTLNPSTGVVQQFTNFGSFTLAGDLTFQNGKLFGTSSENFLVDINYRDSSKNTFVFQYDIPSTLQALGVVSNSFSCDSSIAFITATDDLTTGGTHNNHIYAIDPINKTTTFLCETPRTIFGATSMTEWQVSDCSLYFDLDLNDDSGATDGDYQKLNLCDFPSGGLPVSDTIDTQIEVGLQRIDSLVLRLSPLGGDYFLVAKAVGSVSANQVSPFSATFVGNPSLAFAAANADFQKSLVATRLFYSGQNGAATVVLEAILFVGAKRDTVFSTFEIQNAPSAGRDSSLQLCQNSGLFEVKKLLSADAAPGGNWWPALFFDPLIVGSQTVSYAVGQGDCPLDTAFFEIEVIELPAFSLGSDMKICPNEPPVLLAAPFSSASWQDGSVGQTFETNGSGLFWAEVQNSLGCAWRDSILIEKADTVRVDFLVEKCLGQSYFFDGTAFSIDTFLCRTTIGANGCDSTFCLDLRFFSTKISIDTTLCPNQSLFWQGVTWPNGNGFFAQKITAPDGCLLEATVLRSPKSLSPTLFEASICSGASYFFVGDSLRNAGIFRDTLLSSSGCDSILTLTLNVLDGPSVSILGDSVLQIEKGESQSIVAKLVGGNGPVALFWQPDSTISCGDCLSAVVAPTVSTLFELQAIDSLGCVGSDRVFVVVVDDAETKIYAPNAFSPDGDGLNDVFQFFGDPKSEVTIQHFLIFDRWGELVFEQKNGSLFDPKMGWDGSFRGQPAPPGVYVWRAELLLFSGERIRLAGDVTLIR